MKEGRSNKSICVKKKHSTKDMSHHGIISVMCDELGIVSSVDESVSLDPRMRVTTGEYVKLMIINALGSPSCCLCMGSEFFASKPIERFLGRKIRPKDINNERMGLCLDACHNNIRPIAFSNAY